MRRFCLFGALLVVLLANGWGVWQAKQNRAEPSGGTLHLTERELPLQPIALESSATVLRLNWDARRIGNERFGPVLWLDNAKLAELGFDGSVPLDSAKAHRHYSSMPARRVFLVLEYQGEASEQSAAKHHARTGLVVVDAGQNPDRLRARYPDRAKNSICPGTIRLRLNSHDANGGVLSNPQLEGWVGVLLPSQVSVPRPANRLLTQFHWTVPEAGSAPATEPRFAARVHWGKNYEPWVADIQAISGSLTNR